MLTAADHEELLKAAGGVVVVHNGTTTWGHYERVPAGVLGSDGRAEVLGSKPSVVIATGILSAFGHKKGIGERVTILVPDEWLSVLDHPAEKEWEVANVLPGGREGDEDGMTLRLMLTEVRV